MKTLLRSCFLADPRDKEDLFLRNYMHLLTSGLGFEVPEDDLIWTFIKDFFSRHTHVPSLQTLRAHFARIKEMEVVDRLETVAGFPPLTRGDFVRHLEEKAEDRRSRLVLEHAKSVVKIVETGIEIRDGKKKTFLKGAVDACRYFQDMSHAIVAPTLGAKLSGDLIGDTAGFKEHYERVEADPHYGVGCHSGLEQMDKVLNGARKGELWIHAGFTGSMKSSLALHWAYVQAVYFHNNVFYCSLEMPYTQCRNIIHVMHSYHEKFRAQRIKYGVQVPSKQQTDGTWVHYDRGLEYEKIKNGKLDPHEKRFLFEVVERDLEDREANAYGGIHLECADPDKTDYTVLDLRTKAEIEYSKNPFDIMFIDHLGLMAPRKWMRTTTENLNEVVRDVKKLALGFNRGMGMAVVGLFQISRDGWRAAEKADGRYNLTALSYSNECLTAKTQIWTDQGLLPVVEVTPGMKVWSCTGWRDVLDYFDQGKCKTWEVETDRGALIEGTANHRVRVLRDGDIVWVEFHQLQPNDWLLSTRNTYPGTTVAPALPSLEFRKYEKPQGEQGIDLVVPSNMTPELAWLLGAWDGDGGNRNEKHVQDRLSRLFRVSFHHPLNITSHQSRPGSFDCHKWPQSLSRWFDGVSGVRGVEVPKAIKQAPRESQLAYLSGLFDTEGGINNQFVVGLRMKSEAFLREIQILMAALGYDTHLFTATGKRATTGRSYTSWTLHLRGRETLQRFHDEIGFTEPAKQARVVEALTRKVKDKRMYPVAAIFYRLALPLSPYRLEKEGIVSRGFCVQHQRAKQGKPVSHSAIVTLVKLLRDKGERDPAVSFLESLVSYLQLVRVRRVRPTGHIERVFDIEVSGDHEYQSGPVLSHNCERSADIVTASWIDDELKAQGRFYIQCLKSRDTAPFERFAVRVEFHCRRLLVDYEGVDVGDEESKKKQNEAIGDELDELFAA